ncbi:MAG TPA: PAS domain-containing protein, partial [Candidatus Ozemobacteraceae bacterium]|nr:PAS domain-containing protein [Candidatus Ozemobacteraceae bacterium]
MMELIRVCIVTDDRNTFEACSEMLSSFSPGEFKIEWLAGFESAIEELKAFSGGVFLVDEFLKTLSCWDLLATIRQYPGIPPIIVLSHPAAGADTISPTEHLSLEERAMREGAFDLLPMPQLTPVLLVKMVRYAHRHSHTIADLATSEERYALAMKGTTDGIWDWNLETDEVFFSSRWKSLLGLAEDSIGSRPDEWFQRVHPADVLRLKGQLASHLAGHTPHFESEYRVLHHDGTYRWVISRGASVRGPDGKAYRMVGSQTDISGRKKVEQEILHRTVFEMLIRSISTKFINCPSKQIREAIAESLKSIG